MASWGEAAGALCTGAAGAEQPPQGEAQPAEAQPAAQPAEAQPVLQPLSQPQLGAAQVATQQQGLGRHSLRKMRGRIPRPRGPAHGFLQHFTGAAQQLGSQPHEAAAQPAEAQPALQPLSQPQEAAQPLLQPQGEAQPAEAQPLSQPQVGAAQQLGAAQQGFGRHSLRKMRGRIPKPSRPAQGFLTHFTVQQLF